ncbi:hypothetical protein PUN28_015468 [Cardiocondyla obscurior]|uniref:Uncharacterized protein n=1 Tax=Cardiocondyla obscurior TaxID=286306 RepID=A0AAW2EY89_9HYME
MINVGKFIVDLKNKKSVSQIHPLVEMQNHAVGCKLVPCVAAVEKTAFNRNTFLPYIKMQG